MKHFVVIANAYKDRNFALTNKIVAYIEQKGGTAKGLMSNVEAISDNEFELEDIPQDTQCILVLGGDGTLIRAATRVETLEIPAHSAICVRWRKLRYLTLLIRSWLINT